MMNLEAGLHRLAVVVAGLGVAWAVLLIALGAAIVIVGEAADRWGMFVLLIVVGMIGYVAARVLAWVIRGFAEPKTPSPMN